MARLRLSAAAERDLAEAFGQGLDRFGPAVAEEYALELFEIFDLIAEHPWIGRMIDGPEAVLIHPHKAHVIVYEVDAEGVLILRIRHGREDWSADPAGEPQ